jgi:hypothetical protein
MPQNILRQRILAAAQAGFLAEDAKETLMKQLKLDLKI